MAHKSSSMGFTLIETLIALGLVSIIAGLGIAGSMRAYRTNALNSEKNTIASLLIRARTLAMEGSGNVYGFCFDRNNDDYVVFRDVEERTEVLSIQRSLGIRIDDNHDCDDGNAITFSYASGIATAAEVLISDGNKTGSIRVNHEGLIVIP